MFHTDNSVAFALESPVAQSLSATLSLIAILGKAQFRIGNGQDTHFVAIGIRKITRVGRGRRIRERVSRLKPPLPARPRRRAGELNDGVGVGFNAVPHERPQVLISRQHQRPRLPQQLNGTVPSQLRVAVGVEIRQRLPCRRGLHTSEKRLRQADLGGDVVPILRPRFQEVFLPFSEQLSFVNVEITSLHRRRLELPVLD